jgi:hypothetical protein
MAIVTDPPWLSNELNLLSMLDKVRAERDEAQRQAYDALALAERAAAVAESAQQAIQDVAEMLATLTEAVQERAGQGKPS